MWWFNDQSHAWLITFGCSIELFGWAWLLCEQSKQTGPNSRCDASSLVSIKPFWTKAYEFRVLEWLQGQGRNFRSPTQRAHKIWKSPARGTFKISVETIRLPPKKQNDMEILFCPRLPQIPPHDPSRREGCFHKMLRSIALIPTPLSSPGHRNQGLFGLVPLQLS